MGIGRTARAIIAPFVSLVITGGAGFAAASWASQSTASLDQRLIDEVTAANSTTDPFAAAPSGDGPDQATALLNQYLEEVFSGLLTWTGFVSVACFVCALAWALAALARERSVFGPKGQSSFQTAWWVGLVVYVATLVGANLFLLKGDLLATMNDIYYYTVIFGLGVLGAVFYWVATQFAASPVMRPSVPGSLRR